MNPIKKGSEGHKNPRGVLVGTFRKLFLITTLQKVRGWVVKFTWLRRGNNYQKILLTSWAVKGKIAFGNSSDFQAQFEDLRLYSRMVPEICQSLSTGRTLYLRPAAFLAFLPET
jgi:hypothetical protein